MMKRIQDRLKKREYAEQGIPVLLMLEDLTENPADFSPQDPFEGEVLSNLIEEFAALYEAEKSQAEKGQDEKAEVRELTEDDIGKIIEAVTAKYFIFASTGV